MSVSPDPPARTAPGKYLETWSAGCWGRPVDVALDEADQARRHRGGGRQVGRLRCAPMPRARSASADDRHVNGRACDRDGPWTSASCEPPSPKPGRRTYRCPRPWKGRRSRCERRGRSARSTAAPRRPHQHSPEPATGPAARRPRTMQDCIVFVESPAVRADVPAGLDHGRKNFAQLHGHFCDGHVASVVGSRGARPGRTRGARRPAAARILQRDAAAHRLACSTGIHEPDLVFPDEPTSGLDPMGRVIGATFSGGAWTKTVFLNSAPWSEIEITCDE